MLTYNTLVTVTQFFQLKVKRRILAHEVRPSNQVNTAHHTEMKRCPWPQFVSWTLCSRRSCLFGEILKGVFLGSPHLCPESNKGELQGYHFMIHQQSHGCLNLHFTSQLQLSHSSTTTLVVNKQPLPVYRARLKRFNSC